MLTFFSREGPQVLRCDDYYIRQLASGLDELIFSISIWDPAYAVLDEERKIRDRDQQTYVVKQIDAGASMAKVICQLDLDDWKSSFYKGYGSATNTLINTLNAIKPAGWTVVDESGSTIRRSLQGDFTPLEIVQECCAIYGVYPRWDTVTKTLRLLSRTVPEPAGAFATRELNLKEINYKGKSTDFATRLYATGKAGLTFADINGGKDYVEDFTYSDKVICAYWSDERYTVKENLLTDARLRLADLARPKRSYDCSVRDLRATDPKKYGFLDFSLLSSALLVDDIREASVVYQVVERHEYPYWPEKNHVIFNTSPALITESVTDAINEIFNPNSPLIQEIKSQTDWLLSDGGYIKCVLNDDGSWQQLLFLDKPSTKMATRCLRINQYGIGFASGEAGTFDSWTYSQAWTLDGILSIGGVNDRYGTLNILSPSGDIIGQFNNKGILLRKDDNNWTRIGYDSAQNGAIFVTDTDSSAIAQQGILASDNVSFNKTRNSNSDSSTYAYGGIIFRNGGTVKASIARETGNIITQGSVSAGGINLGATIVQILGILNGGITGRIPIVIDTDGADGTPVFGFFTFTNGLLTGYEEED